MAYFNESGRMAGESCCSGSRDNDTCLSLCPTFLTVCLQHHSAFIPEFPACTYGHAVTPVFNRSLTDDVKPTKNMYFIKIPFQFSWPVSIYVFKSKTRYLIKELSHYRSLQLRFRKKKTQISQKIIIDFYCLQ